MNFNKPLFALLASSFLFFTSCSESKKTDTKDKNDKLIAQANIVTEEKIPNLSELVSGDIGFEKFNTLIADTEFKELLAQKGPYTVFVPLNGAIEKLHPKLIESLKKPENKTKLTQIMNCHIIPGLINRDDIVKAIKENGGSVTLKTLGGVRLLASMKRDKIYLIDKAGNAGRLMINDLEATNGIVHTIESVMMPK